MAQSHRLVISPATVKDIPAIGQLYGATCLPSAFQQALYSEADPAAIIARVSARMSTLAFQPGQKLFKADWDGKLAGYAWWTEPVRGGEKVAPAEVPAVEAAVAEEKPKPAEDYPAGVRLDLMNAYRETLAAHQKTINGPHYELNMLGVHPDYQRKGIASALFEWGVTQAQKDGVELHLSASEAGIPLYTRHGLTKFAEPLWLEDKSAAFYPMVLRMQPTTSPTPNTPASVPYTISPAEPPEIPAVVSVFGDAFAPYEPQPSLYSQADSNEVLRFRAKAWANGAFLPGNTILKAVKDGEIVGFAWWGDYPAPSSNEGKASAPVQDDEGEFAPGTRVDLIHGFREDYAQVHKNIKGPYVKLNYIGVLHTAQKMGIAAALMARCVASAGKRGLDIRFCASKEGMALYSKFGAVPYAEPIWMRDRSAPFVPLIIRPTPSKPLLPPLEILPAEEIDMDRAAELYATAFHPGTFGQALWADADPGEMARLAGPRLRKKWADEKERMFKGVRDGKIVGWAWWTVPTWPGEEEAKEEATEAQGAPVPAPAPQYAKGTKVELLEQFSEDLQKHEDTLTGPHYYLQQLGTDVNHQRTGIAAQMIQWGLEAAKKDGVPLYLDATIEGIPLYEKLGCKRFAEPVWIRNQSAAFYPMVYNSSETELTMVLQ